MDKKYYVYRVAIGNELSTCGPIELSDGSDDDNTQSENAFLNDSSHGNDTDDECPSADEMDVKPDIHTLMRSVNQNIKIKEEVAWNCYEYEKSHNIPNDTSEVVDGGTVSSDDDCYADEQPQKRMRREEPDYMYSTPEPQSEDQIEQNNSNTTQITAINANKPADAEICVPEYQMSDATLKEKVKNVTRSRGSQLAFDMLTPKASLLNKMSTGPKAKQETNNEVNHPNSQGPCTSILSPPPAPLKIECDSEHKSLDDLNNEFISEVTSWEFKWIVDKKPNPLRFKMDVRPLEINSPNLHFFQRFVLDFL